MTPGLRLDLHVHSDRSPDGRTPIDRLVARLAAVHLDGLALTDHNTVAGHAALAELSRGHPELRLIPGVEISTLEGHLLAYGLSAPPPGGRPVAETIAWVTDHGGVPVLAHPFRRVHGVGGVVARASSVPALEVVNGHNGPSANARARDVAAARSLGTTGGSDTHDARELGRAWTRFPEGADSIDDLLEALRHGSTVAEGRWAGPLTRSRIALRSLGLRLRRGLRAI
jgi:hypothetical protein